MKFEQLDDDDWVQILYRETMNLTGIMTVETIKREQNYGPSSEQFNFAHFVGDGKRCLVFCEQDMAHIILE